MSPLPHADTEAETITIRTTAVILTTVLLAVAFAPVPTVVAEGPLSGECDDSGLLVCAGADAGANVQCTSDLSGNADCSWTHGWITTAYSPAGLPGSESHTATVVTTVCAGSDPCSVHESVAPKNCAWLPGGSCDDAPGFGPFTASTTLEMGECLRVEVDVTVSIDATVDHGGLEIASVSFTNTGGDAGVACLLNNGR